MEEGTEEVRAKENGWSDKDDWKGDPEKWVDAKTFNERGDKIAPIARERNGRLFKEVRELKGIVVQQHAAIQKARVEGYQTALKDLEKKRKEAVASGDEEAFAEIEKETKAVTRAIQTEAAAVVQAPDLEFEEWRDKNSWFDDDEDLRVFASGISMKIQRETGLGGRKLYDEVTKRVKKVFPEKFTNSRREEPDAVDGGSPAAKPSGKRTFESLPSEHKKAFDRLKKTLAEQGHELTKEEYLSNYQWD